jgi:hypothetical protein
MHGIHARLRDMKAFGRWLEEAEYLDRAPKVVLLALMSPFTFTAKRNVLLVLGSYPTLNNGVVEFTPFEWLTPIEQGFPALNAAIDKVHPQDLQKRNPEIELIRSTWLGV